MSGLKFHTSRLFTSRRYPIHYLVIPKCGCTFIKNVLWHLENDASHGNALRIHDDDNYFQRADALGLTAEQIIMREHAFTVVRNPIDRFFSLYSDKVVGKGHARFVPLRKVLVDNHGLRPDVTSVRLKTLMLQKLDTQLPLLLGDIVPDITSVMKGLERNKTSAGVTRDDVLDQELRSKINGVYSGDRKLFNQTRKLWAERDPQSNAEIPRFGDIPAA
jgi:hypothetical protein